MNLKTVSRRASSDKDTKTGADSPQLHPAAYHVLPTLNLDTYLVTAKPRILKLSCRR